MPLHTLAEVIAAIALFAVFAVGLAWVAHQSRRVRLAHQSKLPNTPLRRRAF
jgi:hypothetical protein